MNRSAIQPEPRSPQRKVGASLAGAIRDAGNKVGRGIEQAKQRWWLWLDRFSISFGSASSLGELDRLPALERLGGFIGQQLSFQPVLQRGARRGTSVDCPDESVQGLVIALFNAFDPAEIQAVFDDFITEITRYPAESLPAGLNHAFGAKHFDALIIPVPGAPGAIDLAKGPAAQADSHDTVIDAPDFGHFGIHQGRPEHINLFGLILTDPAQQVEEMHRLIAQLPARGRQVADRR